MTSRVFDVVATGGVVATGAALTQVTTAPESTLSAGAGSAIYALAISQLVTVAMVWLKNRHDQNLKTVEIAAAEAKEARLAKQEKERAEAELEKEKRLRQWQIEDRERLAREVERSRADLQETAAASHDIVLGAIKENTEINAKALDASNHTNDKIARLTDMFDQAQRSRHDAADISDRRLVLLETATPIAPTLDVRRVDETTKETLETTRETLEEVKKQADP